MGTGWNSSTGSAWPDLRPLGKLDLITQLADFLSCQTVRWISPSGLIPYWKMGGQDSKAPH